MQVGEDVVAGEALLVMAYLEDAHLAILRLQNASVPDEHRKMALGMIVDRLSGILLDVTRD